MFPCLMGREGPVATSLAIDEVGRLSSRPLWSALAAALDASTENVGRASPALPTNLPTLSVDKRQTKLHALHQQALRWLLNTSALALRCRRKASIPS